MPFKLRPDDAVILSSRAIPVPQIIANRSELLRRLNDQQVRVYDDVHVSGHASREDIRKVLTLLDANYLIPNHGVPEMTEAFIDVARDAGFGPDRIRNLREGDRITLAD